MKVLLLSFSLLCSVLLRAQNLQGIIVDEESGSPLPKVWVHNLTSDESVTSGPSGSFSLIARKGDNLQFSLVGYASKGLLVASEQNLHVTLGKRSMVVDTVVIRPGLTPYQEDSLERRKIYGQKLDKRPTKFGYNKSTQAIDAPISSLFQKKTRKYKRLKAFQDRFQQNEKQLFVDSRYTPAKVEELTGLTGDSLMLFMGRNPMAYDFARSASELEMEMWIKFNYREWIRKASWKGVK